MKDTMLKSGSLLILAMAVLGCTPTGKPPRKKLPDMLDSGCLAPEQMEQTGKINIIDQVPLDSMITILPAMGRINRVEQASRKKLTMPTDEWWQLCPPAYNQRDAGQAANGSSLCTIGETTIAGKSYYAVQMTDAAYDAAILNIVKSYSAFAGSIMNRLLDDGREGAVIDLRSEDENNSERAGFLLKNSTGQSFSLIFVWNHLSAGRASIFMNELQQLPGITSTRIDNNKNF